MQRVSQARVRVDGLVVGEVGAGLCCLVGVTHDDGQHGALKLAGKIWHLRVFSDENGHMNRSVADTGGEVLVVSQFTPLRRHPQGPPPVVRGGGRPR